MSNAEVLVRQLTRNRIINVNRLDKLFFIHQKSNSKNMTSFSSEINTTILFVLYRLKKKENNHCLVGQYVLQ